MNLLHPILLSPVLLLASLAAAQEPRNVSGGVLIPEQACYDVKHYDLVLAVDPAAESIEGSLTMRATLTGPAAKLALDLDPALAVRGAKLDGSAVPFAHENGRIWITPANALEAGSEFAIEIAYGGKAHEARRPPWDGGFTWKKTKDGEPWIATSCQGEGADLWWPCKDHPSDKPDGVDLHITVPKGLVVASNGTRQGKPKVDGKLATFHWRVASPISNYCIALNIAPYVELDDTFTCVDGTKMPIQFFVLPESVEKAKRFMGQFLDHVKVFEEILGPYPFRAEKYGIAETPHLGMEHQTIIAYGNGWKDEDEKYDWLHNHELSHEWWGNLVTCRDWKDMWIHEGFGTYMQPLYRERRFGRAAYQEEMQKASKSVRNMSPVAPRETKDSHEIYFGAGGGDIYYKGSWVLHTLRWQMGDEKFFQALREFCYPTEAARKATDGSQVRLVDTDEFVALCTRIAGEDLAWFFEVYVRQPRLPRLHSEKQDGMLKLRWETPQDLPFSLPVPVLLQGKEVRVAMKDGLGELKVGAAEYEIDPEQRMLMVRPKPGGR
ncbi:MAG TPA: M1 family metallopeptidase [Planctomycetota bacterium]|nr:M1 family metallopeptidase [Planctomycetota bacterium]